MNPANARETRQLYEFGPFRLIAAERLLFRHGERISLAPKAFDTLLLLVEHSGHVLTKDELIRRLWPDSFVEENNLTQQISQLRRALGEGTTGQDYIETVPKLGYRFIPEVRALGEGEVVVSKRTRTRIVLREEEEEAEIPGDLAPGDERAGEIARAAGLRLVTRREAPRMETRLSPGMKFILLSCALVAAATAALFAVPRIRNYHSADSTNAARRPAIAPAKPRYSVAVLGFKNLSGRTEEDWLSTALAEMLTTELSAGGQIRVVPGEEVQRIRSDIPLTNHADIAKPELNKIRNRVGADLTVSGSFVEVGREPNRQIRLDLRLQDTAAGETVFSTAVTGRTEELFALVSHSGAALRSKLGVPMLSALEGAQDQAALPSTQGAARLYSEGLTKLRVFDAPAAQKLLAKAVEADPNFALGHSALAAAWSALGYDEKAKAEGRRALDLSLNLSREEHLLIAGQYSDLTRDWDGAVATYQDLFTLFPDNVDDGLRLASAQTSAGKGSSALATIEKLRKLPPPANSEPQIDLAQATAAESLGDFKQALEASDRGIWNGQLLGERLLVARSWANKSWALRRLGQPQAAVAGLREAKRTFAEAGDVQGVGWTLQLMGGMQSEQGNFAEAARSYQEAIAIFRRIGDRRALALTINGLAVANYDRGDLQAARALYQQYYEIEREVGSKVNTAGALGNLANVEDGLGNLAEARRLNEESVPIFAEVGDQRAMGTALANLATAMYEQGDLAGARKELDQALEIKRKIGYQRGVAYDLAALGEIDRAENNLTAAQKKHEEALTIRTQIGEKHNAAESRLYLAVLALENHSPVEAERITEEIAREFDKEKSPASEASAEEVLARSLAAQAKYADARAAIRRAKSLARGLPNLPLSFDIAVTSARIDIFEKDRPSVSAAANAKRSLESALAIARKHGYLEYEYKIGLALGEVELRSGDADRGTAHLEAISQQASAKGFLLAARHAAEALQAYATHLHLAR